MTSDTPSVVQAPIASIVPLPTAPRRVSPVMASLYATTVMMQALDIHSTFAALDHGATELNPVMRSLTDNRPAFALLKAATAATTILAAHRLGEHHRVKAIVLLVAVNAGYAAIVRNNYRAAR